MEKILDGIAVTEYKLDGRQVGILETHSDVLVADSKARVDHVVTGLDLGRNLLQSGVRIVRDRLGGNTVRAAYGGKMDNILDSVAQIKISLNVLRDQDETGLRAKHGNPMDSDGQPVPKKDLAGWDKDLGWRHSYLVKVLTSPHIKAAEILAAAGLDGDLKPIKAEDRKGSLQTLAKLAGSRKKAAEDRKKAAEKKAAEAENPAAEAEAEAAAEDLVSDAFQNVLAAGFTPEQWTAFNNLCKAEAEKIKAEIKAEAEKIKAEAEAEKKVA